MQTSACGPGAAETSQDHGCGLLSVLAGGRGNCQQSICRQGEQAGEGERRGSVKCCCFSEPRPIGTVDDMVLGLAQSHSKDMEIMSFLNAIYPLWWD